MGGGYNGEIEKERLEMKKLLALIWIIAICIWIIAGINAFSPYEIKVIKKNARLVEIPIGHACSIVSEEDLGYIPTVELEQMCWARALRKLNEIKFVKGITHAKFVGGTRNGLGHAWIFYLRDGEERIYDPSFDEYVTYEETQ